MDFNDSHKQEVNARLPFGVSKVKIIGFNLDKTQNGSEFLEIGFVDGAGAEDKARLYFTDKSARFSLSTLRGILVHNVSEANKEKARAAIDAVPNTQKLVDLLTTKLIDKEMWVTKYLDPNRTYEKEGQIFQSININVFPYEPTLNQSLMPKDKPKESVADAAESVFGASTDVPFNDDGSDPDAAKGKEEGWS